MRWKWFRATKYLNCKLYLENSPIVLTILDFHNTVHICQTYNQTLHIFAYPLHYYTPCMYVHIWVSGIQSKIHGVVETKSVMCIIPQFIFLIFLFIAILHSCTVCFYSMQIRISEKVETPLLYVIAYYLLFLQIFKPNIEINARSK